MVSQKVEVHLLAIAICGGIIFMLQYVNILELGFIGDFPEPDATGRETKGLFGHGWNKGLTWIPNTSDIFSFHLKDLPAWCFGRE